MEQKIEWKPVTPELLKGWRNKLPPGLLLRSKWGTHIVGTINREAGVCGCCEEAEFEEYSDALVPQVSDLLGPLTSTFPARGTR